MINDFHWKTDADCQFNLPHKPKKTENVLNGNEMRKKTETGVMLCKTFFKSKNRLARDENCSKGKK